MLLNPFAPIAFIKFSSLKASVLILLILLIKSNLLRLKGGLIGGLFALLLLSGILTTTSLAIGAIFYAYKVKKESSKEEDSSQNLETVNIWILLKWCPRDKMQH